jgi:parallel beta-helix repeat protein
LNGLELRRRRVLGGVFTLISLASAPLWSGCASRGPLNAIPSNTAGNSAFEAAGSKDGALPAITVAVTNLKDSGTGSLRAAIQAVNARQAAHAVITFAVSGTIRLASDLPQIRTDVAIDGSSAPKYAGKPIVEVDANGHGGLVFRSGSAGSKLLALAIANAKGNGVTLNAGSITLNLNYIGLDLKGVAFGNSGDGIYVSAASSNNRIGLNRSGASGAVANVISGNAGDGLSLHGSSGNVIAANRIGTNPTGKFAIANGQNGIWLTASSGNEIGGTRFVDSRTGQANNPTGSKGTVTPVFVVPPDGNLVSGNAGNGILIDKGSQQNTLNGNFIGTTADGDAAIANSADGVRIVGAPNNSLIGCKFRNNPFVYYNVMSGNLGNGLHITSSDSVLVQGNFFGIGANNSTVVANNGDGILIDGSSQSTQVGGVIPLGNVSAGNVRNGIEVAGTAAGFITFNTFGGLLAFKGAAPNGNDGLLITATGRNQLARTNVFSGNMNNGIEIGGDASGVTIGPDIIGLSTKGNSLLPNGNDGVRIDGTAYGNFIGDYDRSVIPQNTFSGNLGYGVAIVDGAHDNQVLNSFVGLDVAGLAALSNQQGGIYVGAYAAHNLIGGSSSDTKEPKKNTISGNVGDGVTLGKGSSYTAVIDNWIGLNRHGDKVLPNSGHPIVVKPGSVHNKISGNVTCCN